MRSGPPDAEGRYAGGSAGFPGIQMFLAERRMGHKCSWSRSCLHAVINLRVRSGPQPPFTVDKTRRPSLPNTPVEVEFRIILLAIVSDVRPTGMW